MAGIKILRHVRGDRKSTINPSVAYVVIMDASMCERRYFEWFRGYKMGNNNVLYKKIISDKDRVDSKLRNM